MFRLPELCQQKLFCRPTQQFGTTSHLCFFELRPYMVSYSTPCLQTIFISSAVNYDNLVFYSVSTALSLSSSDYGSTRLTLLALFTGILGGEVSFRILQKSAVIIRSTYDCRKYFAMRTAAIKVYFVFHQPPLFHFFNSFCYI